MNCDYCGQAMNYTFYINDAHWIKVVGEEKFDNNVGRVCAHCTLERLGGLDWYVIWNEPTERIRKNMEDTREDGQVRRERSHTPDCELASDHEGDCPRPAQGFANSLNQSKEHKSDE